jgi:hypothetical protein
VRTDPALCQVFRASPKTALPRGKAPRPAIPHIPVTASGLRVADAAPSPFGARFTLS